MRLAAIGLLILVVGTSSSGCMMLLHEEMHHTLACQTSAEYPPCDTLTVALTVGLPFLAVEYLTIVPFIVDWILVRDHDRRHGVGRYKPK